MIIDTAFLESGAKAVPVALAPDFDHGVSQQA
jgi:hypothetical protein